MTEERMEQNGIYLSTKKIKLIKKFLEETSKIMKRAMKKIEGKDWDLLSNCCNVPYDPFGIVRDDGSWDEKCSKCGKHCQPVYVKL